MYICILAVCTYRTYAHVNEGERSAHVVYVCICACARARTCVCICGVVRGVLRGFAGGNDDDDDNGSGSTRERENIFTKIALVNPIIAIPTVAGYTKRKIGCLSLSLPLPRPGRPTDRSHFLFCMLHDRDNS